MKTTGLEEHFVTADVLQAWRRLEPHWKNPARLSAGDDIAHRLAELDGERLAAMEDTGLDVQVLSLTSPGVQNLAPHDAVTLQMTCNDLVADAVARTRTTCRASRRWPPPIRSKPPRVGTSGNHIGPQRRDDLPRSRGRSLEHRDFWPIFEAAAALNAPLYLHPQVPPPPVQAAYYSGFDDTVNAGLATYGIGWHYDVGVALLRLILAGVFDHFPILEVVVGHWGEMVLFYLDRVDNLATAAERARPISEYFCTNVLVTPSGIFSQRYLRWALEVIGVDRILFSTDYPYRLAPHSGARRFLAEADLTDVEREKIASGNWDRICAGIRR